MKILIAPQAFKGSLAALQVAKAIKIGIERSPLKADLTIVPVADGGEGTVDAIVTGSDGKFMKNLVAGPLGQPVEATWGIHGDGETAVIEMAAASGLPLVPTDKRNPALTSTFGTGELIEAALDHGCRKFIIGIGGSATNDAGTGMARALGVKFLDRNGRELPPGGAALLNLDRIDTSGIDYRVSMSDFSVACDVPNPLTGPDGASFIFGPQKGASSDMVIKLDEAMVRFAKVVESDLGAQVADRPGAGAAGGLGAGCVAFLNARLRPGTEIVFQYLDVVEKMRGMDLVITGEGRMDTQTILGKAPIGVAMKAKEYGLPVIVVAGGTSDDYQLAYEHGVDAVISIPPHPATLEECQQRVEEFVSEAAERVARLLVLGRLLRV